MSKEPITGRQPRSRLDRRVAAGQAKAPDLVVIEPLNQWTCAGCSGSGSLLLMENGEPLCTACADLDHLVFLPAGDAALSRRARKASRLAAVVVRFSRSRKRYERQGILVEEAALQQALLMAGVPRPAAREQVRPAIERVLAAWAAPAETPGRGRSTR